MTDKIEPVALRMKPEVQPGVRAALLFALWHHQGGSSPVGQPIREILGMGQHDQLSNEDLAAAKSVAETQQTIDALIAERAAYRQQHARDSAELRALCEQRDLARSSRDSWMAEARENAKRAERAKAEASAQREKVEDATAAIQFVADTSAWIRDDDGRTHLSFRVADNADLSCVANRRDALRAALDAARPEVRVG